MAVRAPRRSADERGDSADDARAIAETLDDSADEVGIVAARRHLAGHARRGDRADAATVQRCAETMASHLRHAAAAAATGHDELFVGYLRWSRQLREAQGSDSRDLVAELEHLVTATGDHIGPVARFALEGLTRTARRELGLSDRSSHSSGRATSTPTAPQPPASAQPAPTIAASTHSAPATAASAVDASSIDPTTVAGRLAHDVLEALLAGDRQRGFMMVSEALDDGMELPALYLEVFQPALWELGRLWQANRITVAQEHLVSAGIQVAMAQLLPRATRAPRNGRVAVVASMEGELHEIGARMVADLLESAGWTIHYVGANTPTSALADLAAAHDAQIVAVSVTVASNLARLHRIIANLRSVTTAAVLVGGRPFLEMPDLWRAVGADGTAPEARAAAELAHRLATDR